MSGDPGLPLSSNGVQDQVQVDQDHQSHKHRQHAHDHDHHHHSHLDLSEEEKEVADYDVRSGARPIQEVDSRQIEIESVPQQTGQRPADRDPGGETISTCQSSDRTAAISFSLPRTPDPDSGESRWVKPESQGLGTGVGKEISPRVDGNGTRTPGSGARTPGRSTFRDIEGFRYTIDHHVPPPEDHGETNPDNPPPTASPIIWVEFSPLSPRDPLHFPLSKKYVITTIACIFTFWTSLNASSYAIGEGTLERDLGATRVQAAAGLSLYAWGFAVFPMVLAPFSEELGRRPLYIVAGLLYWLFYFPVAKANSIALVLVFRFLQGGAGSVGATLVGGTLADIWPASERGGKMAVFALMAVSGTAFAPVIFSWVEANPRLEWRWIQWIQIILVGVYLPSIPLFMPETRAAVLLKKQARKMRRRKDKVVDEVQKEQGGGVEEKGKWDDGMKYLARGEVGKPKFGELMRVSLIRPIHLLATEPIVIFFTLWISVAWAVMYGLVQSIPYVFQNVYGFGTGRVGLVYLALTIGGLLGYALNFVQEHYYITRVEKKGAEARLYAPMVAGVALACGCFIYAWTTFSHITYVAPCIGIAVIMAGVFTIYLACFSYLADGYSLYASSALAGQSLVRNLVGGSFPMFANPMYENLNPNWASTLFGCIAALLAVIPFIGFFYGPQIRARSKFSKLLLEEERKAAEEKLGRDDAAEPA